MRGDRDSTHTGGMRLASQHVLRRVRRQSLVNFHIPDCYGMVISLHSPRYFHHVSAVGPDHQTHGIGVGPGGAFAVATGVAEIAVSA